MCSRLVNTSIEAQIVTIHKVVVILCIESHIRIQKWKRIVR